MDIWQFISKAFIALTEMTDELLEHFDISGFHWPPRWEHIRGEDYVSFSCDVEEAAWENYEQRCALFSRIESWRHPWAGLGAGHPFQTKPRVGRRVTIASKQKNNGPRMRNLFVRGLMGSVSQRSTGVVPIVPILACDSRNKCIGRFLFCCLKISPWFMHIFIAARKHRMLQSL